MKHAHHHAYQTPAMRAHSEAAWAALAWGGLEADPIPEETPDGPAWVLCPRCGGTGDVGRFGGHGLRQIVHDCPRCDGAGEIHEGDL